MALPSKKLPKHKKYKRRGQIKLDSKNIQSCAKCSSPVLPHQVCKTCGTYKQRQVADV